MKKVSFQSFSHRTSKFSLTFQNSNLSLLYLISGKIHLFIYNNNNTAHTQSEFTSLAATGRISLAANGSLVIHNADKSDEANYLCKSNNGIGKGISWSTSLKVTGK